MTITTDDTEYLERLQRTLADANHRLGQMRFEKDSSVLQSLISSVSSALGSLETILKQHSS